MLRLIGCGGSGFQAIQDATANFIRDLSLVPWAVAAIVGLSSTFYASRASTRTAYG
jgi:hypothetical protein